MVTWSIFVCAGDLGAKCLFLARPSSIWQAAFFWWTFRLDDDIHVAKTYYASHVHRDMMRNNALDMMLTIPVRLNPGCNSCVEFAPRYDADNALDMRLSKHDMAFQSLQRILFPFSSAPATSTPTYARQSSCPIFYAMADSTRKVIFFIENVSLWFF
jgi:hypothetical protein